VFFPSYAYENHVFQYWSQSGMLARLEQKKHVFREPSGGGNNATEMVFRAYSKQILRSYPESSKACTSRCALLFVDRRLHLYSLPRVHC
jgi:hypothetical protein